MSSIVARRLLAALPLVLFLLSGCGDAERRDVLLADFDFDREQTSLFARSFDPADGVHYFGDGFSNHQGNAVWTVAEEATVHLWSAGKDLRVELDCATSSGLTKLGQTVTVAWNGHELGTWDLDSGFKNRTVFAAVPPEHVRPGLNRLTLKPAHVGDPDGSDRRPLGVFVRGLRLAAALTADEREAFAALTAADPDGDIELELLPTGAAPGPGAADRPDVLFLVLDAARADHFGCYGYERDTSPRVDALAAESVVLRNVFAEAPFTLASVASYFSGRSWRDHGVISPDRALDEDITTVAELFKAAGYTTLGWSDNPFVSGGTRMDQGFDEWEEIWSHPMQEETAHLKQKDADWWVDHRLAEITAMLVERRFAAGLDDGPVFSYVHIMPPHGPYVPGPDHDLFSDPAYEGPVDGSTADYRRIVDTRRHMGEGDRRQLAALYDGNIHRGDAVLGRVLEAWRALGRQRDLRIVFLSDHGEAFGEHGRFGHLTTCHDEMIRVPALLWPREAWSELVHLEEAHLTLSDVTALLLREAGVGLPAETEWPRRFAEMVAGDRPQGRSQVLMRTVPEHGQYGVRTDRWLALYDGLRIQGLYDMEADPGAGRNLRLEQPERYMQLIGGLKATLGRAGEGASTTTGLSEEDVKALKAVGYL